MKKRRIIKKRKKKSFQRQLLSLIIGFIVVGCILWIANSFIQKSASRIASNNSENSLQLGTFLPVTQQPFSPSPLPPPPQATTRLSPTPTSPPIPTSTSTPTPTPMKRTPTPTPILACGVASFVLNLGIDPAGCCVEDGAGGPADHCCAGVPQTPIERVRRGDGTPYPIPGAAFWCNAKPVIYLYPEKDTLVDVSVQVPGKISVSIPEYPVGGWKQVLAKPNGELTFQGKIYSELFYESSVAPIAPPLKGFVVETKKVQEFLKDFSFKLGLQENESNELIAYWLPKLQELHSPYVFISVFDPISKDKIDHVEIAPYPDTFIQMILYFKPLSFFKTVEPLSLAQVPDRVGFTAVEWGGIIDK